MRKVKLIYYKSSGKYYGEGEYTTALRYDFEIYPQVRKMKRGEFPGMNSTCLWVGYILVQPENGVSALIDLTENCDE